MNDNVYDRIAMHTQSQAESAPYSYFIDEVITNLINDLMVQKGSHRSAGKRTLSTAAASKFIPHRIPTCSQSSIRIPESGELPANTQIGLELGAHQGRSRQTGEPLQNYSKEMLQLYFPTAIRISISQPGSTFKILSAYGAVQLQ